MTYEDLKGGVPEIERILGYTFRDKSLLMQAFTRSSWCNENGAAYQSNEVLEFFGDSVLSAVIVSFLLSMRTERYRYGIKTELGEGDFSNIKSKLSDKTNLSKSTKRLGLEKYLLMGEGDIKLGIAEEPSVMEDLFESIVGAVYIDTGKDIPTVTAVVSKILDMTVYADSKAPEVSPKNALQEWCADKKRRLPSPVYKTLEERGPDHKKTYVRGVFVGERLVAQGEGKNQKTADARAAEEALKILRDEQSPAPIAPVAANAAGKPVETKNAVETKAPEAPKKPDKGSAKQSVESARKPDPKPQATSESPAKRKAAVSTQASAKAMPQKKPEIKENSNGGRAAKVAESALSLLKRHAERASVASPSFRDLGTFGDGDDLEYHIECSFMGKRVIASGSSRLDARERAAAMVAKDLKIT